MGIVALGLAVVQISPTRLGYGLGPGNPAPQAAARLPVLHTELTRAIGEIYQADFLAEGITSLEDEAKSPLFRRRRARMLGELVAA